ncbi:hypothetical protein J3A83DRAFT_4243103 [Scleroderma citrinum]
MATSPIPAVTATYTLHLPLRVDYPSPLTPSTTHTFPLSPPNSSHGPDSTQSFSVLQEYYTKLRGALLDARVKLGEELTVWRDIVGSEEVGKERGVRIVKDAEESDEEGNGE